MTIPDTDPTSRRPFLRSAVHFHPAHNTTGVVSFATCDIIPVWWRAYLQHLSSWRSRCSRGCRG